MTGARSIRSRTRRGLIVVTLAAALTLLGAAPAWAHATLVETVPATGSVVADTPAEVTLHYSEAVGTSLGSVKILAPDGSRVDGGEVSLRDGGTTVAESLPADLPPGTYTVLWRVLSEDTHSVSGATTFSVGQPSATSVSVSDQQGAGGAAENLLDVARFLLYLGIVALLGISMFLLVLWRAGSGLPAVRRLLWIGWGLATAGSVAGLLLQGPYAAGLPLTSMFDPSLIADVLGTRFGAAALVRCVLLAGVAVLLARGRTRRVAVPVGVVLTLGILLTVAISGHSGSGELVAVTMAADTVHMAAASAWLGGLVLLGMVLLRRPPAELTAVLSRWSRYAAAAVLVLVATGSFTAWRQVRELAALPDTGYGRLLLVKVGLVVGMLALGALGRALILRGHRAAAVPDAGAATELVSVGAGQLDGLAGDAGPVRTGSGDAGPVGVARTAPPTRAPGQLRRLRRGVVLEACIAVAVLAVTSVLVSTVPAKDSYFPEFRQTGPVSAQLQVTADVRPARTGPNELALAYIDPAGAPADIVRASARWTSESGEFVIPVELSRTDSGRYVVQGVTLPTAGAWKLTVTSQTSDIDSSSTLFTVRIR